MGPGLPEQTVCWWTILKMVYTIFTPPTTRRTVYGKNRNADTNNTDTELSTKSASPVPRKIKPVSTRGRKPGPLGKTRGRGGFKARVITSPRRKVTKPAASSSKDASSSDSSTDSSTDSSSEPEKPEKPERPQKNIVQKRAGKEKRSTDQSDDDDDDDDELSDVPDELDDDDVGTVAGTEGTDAGGDGASEMGESTTAAESPVPMVSSRGKGTGRGRGGGRGRGKRGGRRGGDVRRSTRRKQ